MSISFSQEFPIEENNEKPKINFKEQISNALKHKKNARLLGKELINKVDSKIKKSNLILQLRRDFKYFELQKRMKEYNLTEISSKREEYENNIQSVYQFHNKIREEMKDFVSGIDLYDNKVNELENERENILSSSYSIIDKKANEKIQLQKKLNEISHQLNQQIEILKSNEIRFDSLKKQKDDEENKFMQEETRDVDKYNILFKKYRELLTKYNIYEKEEDNDNENDLALTRRAYEGNLMKEDLKIKLTEAKLKNELLKKNFDDIVSKVNLASKSENNTSSIIINSSKKNIGPQTNISTINSTTIGNNSKV
jgi:hypothetical protein